MASVAPQHLPANGNENRQPIIIGFTIWTVVLSAIFVVLRVIVRVGIVKIRLWWDDWFIILAILATVVGGSLDFVEVHYGFGRHQYYLNWWQIMYFTAYTYGEWVQTFFTLMCTKVSICFFLLRIPVHKRYIIPLQIAIAVLIVSNVVLTLLWIFQCWPVEALWDPRIPPKYCFSHDMIYYIILAQAVISVTSDFGLAFYPILIIVHLHMRRREKFGLCVLMGLGVITGSCCIIRTVLNGEAVSEDSTYGGITNWFWRLFEVQLGIICACIPTLIPGYKWVKHRVATASTGSSPKPSAFTARKYPHRRGKNDSSELLKSTQHSGFGHRWGRTFLWSTTAAESKTDSSIDIGLPKPAILSDEGRAPISPVQTDLSNENKPLPPPKSSTHGALNDKQGNEHESRLDVGHDLSFEADQPTLRAILESDRHRVENRV